jgi:chaperonin cofactor prefoldin
VDGTEHDVPTEPTGNEDSRADLENRVEVLASEVEALRDQVVELSASLSALRHNLGE